MADAKKHRVPQALRKIITKSSVAIQQLFKPKHKSRLATSTISKCTAPNKNSELNRTSSVVAQKATSSRDTFVALTPVQKVTSSPHPSTTCNDVQPLASSPDAPSALNTVWAPPATLDGSPAVTAVEMALGLRDIVEIIIKYLYPKPTLREPLSTSKDFDLFYNYALVNPAFNTVASRYLYARVEATINLPNIYPRKRANLAKLVTGGASSERTKMLTKSATSLVLQTVPPDLKEVISGGQYNHAVDYEKALQGLQLHNLRHLYVSRFLKPEDGKSFPELADTSLLLDIGGKLYPLFGFHLNRLLISNERLEARHIDSITNKCPNLEDLYLDILPTEMSKQNLQELAIAVARLITSSMKLVAVWPMMLEKFQPDENRMLIEALAHHKSIKAIGLLYADNDSEELWAAVPRNGAFPALESVSLICPKSLDIAPSLIPLIATVSRLWIDGVRQTERLKESLSRFENLRDLDIYCVDQIWPRSPRLICDFLGPIRKLERLWLWGPHGEGWTSFCGAIWFATQETMASPAIKIPYPMLQSIKVRFVYKDEPDQQRLGLGPTFKSVPEPPSM